MSTFKNKLKSTNLLLTVKTVAMPLDPMILNSILGTFKNMVEECKQKNLSGEDFDKMCETFARMEQLGQEHDDMNAFNAQIMQENLYGQFSDYYGRALSAQAQAETQSEDGGYDDAKLLKQSVNALKQAIQTIQQRFEEAVQTAKGDNAKQQQDMALEYAARNLDPSLIAAGGGMETIKQEADKSFNETMEKTPNAFDNSVEVEVMNNPAEIIKPIQDLIDLGEEPGMTLPKFLRLQIERGMDKAMEGAVVARKGLITELEFTEVNPVSPYHLEKAKEKIAKFDELAQKQKFNVPNWKELSLAQDDIDRKFAPDIAKWETIKRWWEDLIWDLSFWSTSYLEYAPYIEPWSMSDDKHKAVKRTQDTTPGIFREREKLFNKYFGISFIEIFKHPTFQWDVKYNYLGYSQEYIEFLIEKIYPECKPFNHLSSELIEQKEYYHQKNKDDQEREGNPESHFPAERMRVFYNSKFGEGRHESKYGPVVKNNSVATPWNYETFKFKG